MSNRIYTTRRLGILTAIAEKLKIIDGTGEFLENVQGNVHPTLLFWDEINQYPAIHLNAGRETRSYQGGGYKDRFLEIVVRCYVEEEEAYKALDRLLEDVETVLEDNATIEYFDRRGVAHRIHQITILQIDTDEGVLEPSGVGEVTIEVHY